jgi:hypothetical protein
VHLHFKTRYLAKGTSEVDDNVRFGLKADIEGATDVALPSTQQLRQLGDIRRNPARLVAAFLIFVKDQPCRFDIIPPSS